MGKERGGIRAYGDTGEVTGSLDGGVSSSQRAVRVWVLELSDRKGGDFGG